MGILTVRLAEEEEQLLAKRSRGAGLKKEYAQGAVLLRSIARAIRALKGMEEITQKFPTVRLADVIAHYLITTLILTPTCLSAKPPLQP